MDTSTVGSSITSSIWTVDTDETSSTSQESKHSKQEESEIKLTPFKLQWAYGINRNLPVLNLTTKEKSIIVYACTHAAVKYDYKSKEMVLMQGHKNCITNISNDFKGRFLVTADTGEDNVVIIWDTITCVPINCIFDPYPGSTIGTAAISGDAKYLVTVSNCTNPKISFWLWTLGKEEPDGEYEVNEITGKVQSVRFYPNFQEYFVVTFENAVVFGIWNSDQLTIYFPDTSSMRSRISNMGCYNDSTYMPGTDGVYTCTNNGCVIMWATKVSTGHFESETMTNVIAENKSKFTNFKNFQKYVRVQQNEINFITSLKKYVVTGDDMGSIRFYGPQIRILYWLTEFNLGPITAIHFQMPSDGILTDTVPSTVEVTDGDEDIVDEIKKIMLMKVPSDATLDGNPFFVPDFIVSTKRGEIVSVNFLLKKITFLKDTCESKVTALDTHDDKNILVIGNAAGFVKCYNFVSHELLVNNLLPKVKDKNRADVEKVYEVSCLKFSPLGFYLACGLDNGAVWFLDPVILRPTTEMPLMHTRHRIKKFCFSSDSTFMASIDDGMTVCLFKYDKNQQQWHFNGKIRSHYKTIRDLLFIPFQNNKQCQYKLFTIGEDFRLVQYDVYDSTSEELKVVSYERIEQSAKPQAFFCLDENFVLVSEDQYKYKYINYDTAMCHKTVLGPSNGGYVQMMKYLRKQENEASNVNGYIIFATSKNIGIQKFPLDGNPYKHVSMIGHPEKINGMCLSHDDQYLFTCGEDDCSVLQWQINIQSVEMMANLGGKGLNPYYCLLEGGQDGWLFNEMKDLFYLMQIMHQGVNTQEARIVNDYLDLAELPDLMRACGLFLTEFELENMMVEAKYFNIHNTRDVAENIYFEDFVKLYINHKAVDGLSIQKIQEAYELFSTLQTIPLLNHFLESTGGSMIQQVTSNLSMYSAGESIHSMQEIAPKTALSANMSMFSVTSKVSAVTTNVPNKDSIVVTAKETVLMRQQFIEVLFNQGENFTKEELSKCLSILIRKQEETFSPSKIAENIYELLPKDITYKQLTEDILGINVIGENPIVFAEIDKKI